MHVHVAVALEGREDAEGGIGLATETVNQHVDFLPCILAQNIVHIVSVEVIASDETLQVKLVIGILCCHKQSLFVTAKVWYIKKWRKDIGVANKPPVNQAYDCFSRFIVVSCSFLGYIL